MGIRYFFLLLALIAEVLGTIGGFGSSVFFVPLGSFYFDFYSVLGITALFHLSSNISKVFLFKKGINKKLIIYIGIPSVLFVSIGGYASQYVSTIFLEVALGVFLIALSCLFLIKKQLEIKPSKKNSVVGGMMSGFSAGILGTGGAIRGLTMAAFNLEKSVFIATSAIIDLMIDVTRTVVYYNNGYIHSHDLIYIPFLLVIGLLGSYLGKRILHYIPQDKFKRFSLYLILCIGLISILRFVI